ncbi:uncharacterized protein RHO25_011647 [Cercospora beticola]|uniref:DUF1772-domain-containing protein n=1 Tax=Cercospora beticola TaxID=122368 RepID=A0ABZ0P553_CERBT|nr:hypothetical protein RHO25_011647 [Cercospora beticola]
MCTLQKFVPAAAIIGLSSASFLTAYITSFTVLAIPVVETGASKDNAKFAAKQWQKAFDLGKSFAPPFAITCAACFGFLAVQTRGIVGRYPVSPSVLYATAAVLAPSIVPFTIAVMGPTTLDPLVAKADGSPNAPGDQETLDLIKKWSGQNAVRAGLIGSAAVMSAFAILAQTTKGPAGLSKLGQTATRAAQQARPVSAAGAQIKATRNINTKAKR